MHHASVIVPMLYLYLPAIAVGVALGRTLYVRNGNAFRQLLMTAIMGIAGGAILVALYMRYFGGRMSLREVGAACYFGVAVACTIGAFNLLTVWLLGYVFPRRRELPDGVPPANIQSGSMAELASAFCRALLLLAFGIPYAGAMMLIYHPHMVHAGTPKTVLGRDYEEVQFASTDGLRLHGWWIPASKADEDDDSTSPDWGRQTVILCHGFNGDKASDLQLVRNLAPYGFNVLAFDFRAHGESEGQFTTFGDLERRDVLGAVRWMRVNHPEEARKIFGVGTGLGAAALIEAAGDPNEGQAINAVAVLSPYDSLKELVRDTAETQSVPMAGWLAAHLAMPMAGMQLGTPLAGFSPAHDADKIAPRPLMVIGSELDPAVDISLSENVYDQASQPKCSYWIKRGSRKENQSADDLATMSLRVFFETARNVL